MTFYQQLAISVTVSLVVSLIVFVPFYFRIMREVDETLNGRR